MTYLIKTEFLLDYKTNTIKDSVNPNMIIIRPLNWKYSIRIPINSIISIDII